MKKLLSLILLFVLFGSLNVFAATDTNAITVEKNDTFTIKLLEYSSAGYKWDFSIDQKSGVTLVSEDTVSDSDLVGAPITRIFTFKAENVGNYSIKFTEARPWDKSDISETKTYDVKVVELKTKPIANSITVKKGDSFFIELLEHSTAGYKWSYTIDPKAGISLVSDEVDVNSDLIGSPVTRAFTFKAEKVGNYTIKFTEARPWDKSDVSATKIYYIKVVESSEKVSSSMSKSNNCMTTFSLKQRTNEGYNWIYSIDPPAGLTLVSDCLYKNKKDDCGYDIRVFTFKAEKTGTYTINFCEVKK